MDKYFDAHRHFQDRTPRANTIYNATCECDWARIADACGPNIFGAIGIHPWHTDTATDGWDTRLIKTLTQNPDLMIGEIGLDKNRKDITRQVAIFERQIEIAGAMRRRPQIHCVGAWDKLRDILARAKGLPAPLFHGWSGSAEMMREMCERYDAYFSFAATVTDPRHTRARECVATAPENRILVESDDRSPDTIRDAIVAIAEIRNTTPEHIATTTYNNAMGMI